MANLRDISKQSWTGDNTIEHINAGSFQRMADAVEKVASNYDSLRNDRDLYKRWYAEQKTKIEKLERQRAALRGVITRLKKEAKFGKVQ